jgi:GNAT superfamily N-acetyltransferase
MEAVALATGGSVFPESVWQPNPHAELLVPFPERAPTAALLERAEELGARRIGIWLAAPAPDLEEALPALGFTPGWEPHWMTSPATPAEPDPRVREAEDVPEYDDHGRSLLGMIGPSTRLFVARVEGRFAGHAWLHVAAEIGGLYDVFVADDLRRRGLGSALSRAAMAKAGELGVATIALNAEAPALYESLGYRTLGMGRTWWRHLNCA